MALHNHLGDKCQLIAEKREAIINMRNQILSLVNLPKKTSVFQHSHPETRSGQRKKLLLKKPNRPIVC